MKYSHGFTNKGVLVHALLTGLVLGIFEGDFIIACEDCEVIEKVKLSRCRNRISAIMEVVNGFRCRCNHREAIELRLTHVLKEIQC